MGAVEERRRAGDQQVEAGEAATVDLVDELAQRVERLLAHVGPHPLQRLDLVEDQQETGVAGVAQDREQPLQEPERAEVVEVAPHAGVAPDRRGHVRLTAEPRDQTLGGRLVPVELRVAIAAQGGCKRRSRADTSASRFSTSASTEPPSDSSAKSQASSTGRNADGGNSAVSSDSHTRR